MYDKIAGQPGNENIGTTRHHKDAVAAPKRDRGTAAGVEGSASAVIPFFRGTTDIVFLLKDGQIRHFDSDPDGVIMSNYFFESFPHLVKEIHFGELCHYVKNGKVQQHPQRMTREQFFDGVQP
jgi:hypothetical protein